MWADDAIAAITASSISTAAKPTFKNRIFAFEPKSSASQMTFDLMLEGAEDEEAPPRCLMCINRY